MKKLIMLGIGFVAVLAACTKRSDNISKLVTVSAPTINLVGDKFSTINVGAAFTDSGAIAVDDISGTQRPITADTTTSVDPSTPGLYTLTYSAKNANGYGTTVARYVAVTDYADNADISGDYKRLENSAPLEVDRVSRALYSVSDIGAANLGNVGYFAIIDTNTIDFGYQYSETLKDYIEADVRYFHIRPSDTGFQYVIYAAGYGTSVRTFRKL